MKLMEITSKSYAHDLGVAMQEERVNRLRFMILHHDALVAETARWVNSINETAREWADNEGISCRPTIEQLRRQLFSGEPQKS